MKLFQITEDDLAELERLSPEIADACMAVLTNATRIKLRRIQAILSNVRWNYGPPTNVERVDAAGDERE